MNNFQQTYATLYDDQLLRLGEERDTLCTEAQEALDAEIAKRGLLGRELERASPEEFISSSTPAPHRSPWALIGKIVSVITGMIIARFGIGPALGLLFKGMYWIVILLFLIPALIGAGIGGWYRSRPSPNPKVAGFFGWVYLFAWVSPIFGLFIAVMAFRMAPIAARPIRTRWLASIGLILSLVVFGYATYIRYVG